MYYDACARILCALLEVEVKSLRAVADSLEVESLRAFAGGLWRYSRGPLLLGHSLSNSVQFIKVVSGTNSRGLVPHCRRRTFGKSGE